MNISILVLIAIITLVIYVLSKKNLEKFWAYGAGTRVCNNRGCDIRFLQDKGLYYCKNKEHI